MNATKLIEESVLIQNVKLSFQTIGIIKAFDVKFTSIYYP